MASSFQLVGLDQDQFEPLFSRSDDELRTISVLRVNATANRGYPCRVSLQDAEIGDELLLLSYTHQPAATPYQASGPIFVRKGSQKRTLDIGEVPEYVTTRQMSVRAYDSHDMMVSATVCDGGASAREIEKLFDDTQVEYIHLHNAKRGCFSCSVIRA